MEEYSLSRPSNTTKPSNTTNNFLIQIQIPNMIIDTLVLVV